jgi:hypothetical protein
MKNELCIEPSRGATYSSDRVAVYEYGTYGRGSVLAGQTKRMFLDDFETVEEAKAAFPKATVCIGSGYVPVSLAHLPDDEGPDPYGDHADAEGDV